MLTESILKAGIEQLLSPNKAWHVDMSGEPHTFTHCGCPVFAAVESEAAFPLISQPGDKTVAILWQDQDGEWRCNRDFFYGRKGEVDSDLMHFGSRYFVDPEALRSAVFNLVT